MGEKLMKKDDINYGIDSVNKKKRAKKKNNKVKTIFMLLFVLAIGSAIGIRNAINKKNAMVSSNTSLAATNNKDSKDNKEEAKKNEVSQEEKELAEKRKKTGIINVDKDTKVMTVKEIWENKDKKKIAFLTFDDGPSKYTPKILDILKRYNIKATFFVLGTSVQNYPEYLKREVEEGQSIANHSFSHDIRYFGRNTPDYFVQDVKKCDVEIKKVLGEDFKTNLVRFPGGSFGHKSYIDNLRAAGFDHIDWNVENGDATRLNVPKQELIDNVKKEMSTHNHVVILMHDSATKATTVEALPEIIEFLKSRGFEFGLISQNN